MHSCEEAEGPDVNPDPIANPGENPKTEEKLPAVIVKIAKTSNTSSRQLRITAYSKAIITIQTADGDTTSYNSKNIQVQDMEDHYLTEKIILPEGSYQVVAFYVLDDNNDIVEATPKKNATLSENQDLSLPLAFDLQSIETEIGEEAEMEISMQVVAAEGHSPADFGFQSFALDIVTATSNKIFIAMVTDTRLMDFLSGSVEITADGEVITQELIAGINESVTLPIAESYAILLKSFNFDDFTDTLTLDQLKDYAEQPLIVEMKEAGFKCAEGDFPEVLVLTTQTDLNSWAMRCGKSTIASLIIEGDGGEDPIVDLSPLELITYVYDEIQIRNTTHLKNLHGLQNINQSVWKLTVEKNIGLETLEGLSLSDNQSLNLTIADNPSLLNLYGLEEIKKLGSVFINHNAKLINFKGLDQVQEIDYMEVTDNDAQISFEGLYNVRHIGSLEIKGIDIVNFEDFRNVETIGSLRLTYMYDLMDFTGFTGAVTSSLDLDSNNLTSLKGLRVADEMQFLTLYGNTSLRDIKELTNLKKIKRRLNIIGNTNLPTLEGLENLISVDLSSNIEIANNDWLTDYCALSKLVNEGTHPEITINNNGYNPTLEQIQGEGCKGEIEW
ncbi:hypothetical protein ADICYQ_2718 [Cyclobacterium qasimii M12-11B]|uniref:Uncharacterized protein n=1 Tax=Cyclobacterium qasimii M12-11B TaxID=641524 RepID=S7WW62_9BACT|nr:hypothetical protein ADICYQ_2718 [Cyclobacterium qasimii M12-11B]